MKLPSFLRRRELKEEKEDHQEKSEYEKIIAAFKKQFEGKITKETHSVCTTKEYVKMLQEMLRFNDISPRNLARAILPDYVLDSRLRSIELSGSKLKAEMPEGHRILIAPIPFSYHGYELNDDDIADGKYIKALIINKERDKTLGGFFPRASYLHKLFPKELQECSFTVEYKDNNPDDEYYMSVADIERIMKQYRENYEKLRALISEVIENSI